MWDAGSISVDLVAELTSDPVLTILAVTPAGIITILAEPVVRGETLVLRGAHIQDAGPNAIGPDNLMMMAQVLMETMDYDGLEVEGAVRTTGANPGRRPRVFRFTRRVRP